MADEILNEEVKITTTYEADESVLKVIATPEKIVPVEKVYNIEEIKEQLEKYKNARAQWHAKIAPLQAILDKYEEIKPAVEEVVK